MPANRFVYAVHKWMGIVAGSILVVIGLTGSVIVFDDELDRWLNPRLLQVEPGETVRPVDAQVAAAALTFPQGKLDGVFLPVHERAVTEVYFETADHEHWMISVNPYTAAVLGKRPVQGGFVRFIYSLHFTLSARPWGDLVVGLVGIAFIVSSVSGLWVIRHSMSQPFKVGVRKGQGSKRVWSDVHKLVGLATVAFHLVFAVTGVQMMLYAFSPTFLSGEDEALERQGSARRPVVSASHDAMLAAARSALPGFVPAGLGMPHTPGDSVFAYGKVAGSNPIWGPYASSVEMDPATGALVRAQDIRTAPFVERYETVLHQLHFGQYGGNGVRVLYVALGLMPGVLAGSGFVLWWKRRRRAQQWLHRTDAVAA